MVFLHLLQIGVALRRYAGISIDIFPIPETVGKIVKYLIFVVYFALIYIILIKIFPRHLIAKPDFSDSQLKKKQYNFFIYLGLNIVVLVLLLSDRIVVKK